MGSPHLFGNTSALCVPFQEELRRLGAEVKYIAVAEKHIHPCLGCYACQNVQDAYGCVLQDDMQEIARDIVWADCIVLATPIYAWYCPAELKAVLDRHYGMNKYYGTAEGSLWQGRRVALLLTHGYERDYAAEPFVLGIQRLCQHSGLRYAGMFSVQHGEDDAVFSAPETQARVRAFARSLFNPETQNE